MPILTKPSPGITAGYCSGYRRDDLIAKLGIIEHRSATLGKDICETICRNRDDCYDKRELDDFCAVCPLTELLELTE